MNTSGFKPQLLFFFNQKMTSVLHLNDSLSIEFEVASYFPTAFYIYGGVVFLNPVLLIRSMKLISFSLFCR